MTFSNERLGQLMTEYEREYEKRYHAPFIPVTYEDLKKMHDYYKKQRGGECLKSVWVDELTIVHLAYFILTHKEGAKLTDGVRVYLERFDQDRNVSGKTFKKDSENMAFMVTYKGSDPVKPEHLDWLTADSEVSKTDDNLAADNYNDPDPPKNTGSTL